MVKSNITLVTLTALLQLGVNAAPKALKLEGNTPQVESATVTSALSKNNRQPLLPPYSSWPKLPLDGKIFRKSKADLPGGFDHIEPNPPDGDFVSTNRDTLLGLRGILAYCLTCGNKYLYISPSGQKTNIPNNDYLVLKGVGVSGKLGAVVTSSVSYHFFSWSVFGGYRGIQFSSIGRTIVYGQGYDGKNDALFLTRWFLSNGNLQYTKPFGNRYRTSYSSSQNNVAILSFLDSQPDDDSLMQRLTSAWNIEDSEDAFLEVKSTEESNGFISPVQREKYWAALSKYSDYTPLEETDPTVRGYPYWRITNRAARRALHWSENDQVFYTHQPQDPKASSPVIASSKQYPSVWLATPATKTNIPLIERAYDGVPSPDGRFIAFFGWALDEKPDAKHPASPSTLWVFDRTTKVRKRLSNQNAGYIFWRHDSHGLVCARFIGQHRTQISTLSLEGEEKSLATVVADDPEGVREGGTGLHTPLTFKGVSKNNRYLLVDVCVLNRDSNTSVSHYTLKRDLKAVDLSSGAVLDVASARPPTNTNSLFSWDWFDESDAPADNTTGRPQTPPTLSPS